MFALFCTWEYLLYSLPFRMRWEIPEQLTISFWRHCFCCLCFALWWSSVVIQSTLIIYVWFMQFSPPLDVVIESQCILTLVHSLCFVHLWMDRLRNIFNVRYKQMGKVFRPARERPGSSVNWDGWNSRVLSQSHLLQLCRHFLVMSKQVRSDMRGPKLLFLNYIVLTELT